MVVLSRVECMLVSTSIFMLLLSPSGTRIMVTNVRHTHVIFFHKAHTHLVDTKCSGH